MRSVKVSVSALLAAAGFVVSTAFGQDIQWATGVDGLWNDPANWNPANVPDSGGENAILSVAGTYTASYNIQAAIGGLSITRKSATVAMLDSTYLLMYGNVLNNGKIIVNSSMGTTNTFLRFDYGDRTLTGTGQVIMRLGSADLDDARIDTYGGTVTQGEGHTIRGAGNIGASLVNNGTLIADVNDSTLQLVGNTKTNNALMKATAGSNFQVNGITLTQGPAGTLLAEGGRVSLSGATIVGGTLASSGEGQVRAFGANIANSAANQGAFNVSDGSYVLIYGGLANDGVITINEGAGTANAFLRFDYGDLALSGAGEVHLVLGSDDLDDARLDTYGAVVTIGADQFIHGAGNIGAALTNLGDIVADVPGSTLQLVGNNKTNNSLMKAVAGSNFQVNGLTLAQGPEGLLLADEGRVTLVSATISGGTLETSGAGEVRTVAAVNLNGVASQGTLNVNDASAVYVQGGLTNNGVITINENAGAGNAYIRFDYGAQTLAGGGEVRLVPGSDDLNDARFDTYGATVTIGPDQLIHGAGNVGAALINEGTLIADVDGSMLQLVDQNKVNNAQMKSVAGSNLQVNGVTVTQGPGGLILAEEGQVSLYNSTIVGGAIGSSGDGQVRAFTANSLDGVVTNQGSFGITDGAAVYIHQGLTNNGIIAVNVNSGTTNTLVRFDYGDLAVSGSGTLRLVPGSDDLNDAIVGTYGSTLTLGPGQTVEGNGRFSGGPFTIQGTITPGGPAPVGQIDVQGSLFLAHTSAYKAEVGAADSFDQITVSGAATLGGDVAITLLDGFVPDTCFVVPIVTAGSIQGAFDSVNGDAGNGRVWRVAYTATQARAFVTCYADMQPDCALDLFDFLAFVNLFNAGDTVADCTRDGSFDLFDFLCFVNGFNAGC